MELVDIEGTSSSSSGGNGMTSSIMAAPGTAIPINTLGDDKNIIMEVPLEDIKDDTSMDDVNLGVNDDNDKQEEGSSSGAGGDILLGGEEDKDEGGSTKSISIREEEEEEMKIQEERQERRRRMLVLEDGDTLAKFDNAYQLILGKVVVEKVLDSPSNKDVIVRVEWDDNMSEKIETNELGEVAVFSREIGILDRKQVGIGRQVTDGKRRGWVRNKRCVATLSLNEAPDVLIEDVPVELLVRPSPMKKDVKILYDNDWIGLVVQAKSKIHFKVDKDEKIGWLADDEGSSWNDPIPGETLPKLTISMLWDAHWAQASDYWLWNFLKYLGSSATVLRSEIYRLHVAWMGQLGKQIMDSDDETPPTQIEGLETVSEVKMLYGRNEVYLRQHDTWMYTPRECDKTTSYGMWTIKFHDDVFVDPVNSLTFNNWQIGAGDEEMEVEDSYPIVPGSTLPVTVVVFRSVLDIDWEDGTSEVKEMIEVKPAKEYLAKFESGDIVRNYGICGMSSQKTKYGFVEKIEPRGMVKVKWVDAGTGCAPLVFTTTVSQYDLTLIEEWRCLKYLNNCPLVVSEVQLVPSVARVGVLVGVSVADAKIIVRFMDDTERLVWAHEYPRFKGDIKFNFHLGIWTSANDDEDYDFTEANKFVLPTPTAEIFEKCAALGQHHFRIQDVEPNFNTFSEYEFELRLDDARFQIHLQEEISLLKESLPDEKEIGVWIETYSTRPDLFTVTLVGPHGSIYEGHLIVLDLMLPTDYPKGPVKVRVNSQDLSLVRDLLSCGYENGLLQIPSSIATYSNKKSTVLTIVSYIRDHVMNESAIRPEELSPDSLDQDEVNSLYLRVLEYTDTILRYPHPDLLNSDRHEFMKTYYATMLEKIVETNWSYLASCEVKIAGMECADKGIEGASCGFTLSLKQRLEKLREFVPTDVIIPTSPQQL